MPKYISTLSQDQAWLVDRSTNGTWLNGARMERSVPVQIMPGDRVQVGPIEFQFLSRHFSVPTEVDAQADGAQRVHERPGHGRGRHRFVLDGF